MHHGVCFLFERLKMIAYHQYMSVPKYVIVSGYRDFADKKVFASAMTRALKDTIKFDFKNDVIMSGGCRGTDTLARLYANAFDIRFIEVPANWKKHGRGAGPIRNQKMIDMSKKMTDEVYLVAFMHAKSKGTKGMIKLASSAKIEIITFDITDKC
jgi:hypothetical protein